MRRALDGLYAAGAVLAGASLLGIFLAMVGNILLREAGRELPAADDLVAYLCVATTFFALAHTFRRGELIRVGLVLNALPPRARRAQEAVLLVLMAAIVGYVAWWTAKDALFSWEIEEVSQGSVPVPLWIPKLAMPLGAGLLWVAVVDGLAEVAAGRPPPYQREAEARAARGEHGMER